MFYQKQVWFEKKIIYSIGYYYIYIQVKKKLLPRGYLQLEIQLIVLCSLHQIVWLSLLNLTSILVTNCIIKSNEPFLYSNLDNYQTLTFLMSLPHSFIVFFILLNAYLSFCPPYLFNFISIYNLLFSLYYNMIDFFFLSVVKFTKSLIKCV